MILNDDYIVQGKTLKEFEDAASNMEAKTGYHFVRMDQLEVLSIAGTDDDNIYVYRLPHADPWTDNGAVRTLSMKRQKISKASILRRGDVGQALDEAIKVGMMLLNNKKNIYLVSKSALSTLAQRTRSGCDKFYDEYVPPTSQHPGHTTFARDLFLADAMNGVAQLVVRTEGGVNKVFAVMSEKYGHTEQKFFVHLVNEINHEGVMGTAECNGFRITQDLTRLFVSFPDKEQELSALYNMQDFEPGIMFETSDTGECALRATAAWRHGSHYMLTDEVARRHISISDQTIREFIADCKTEIFDKFTQLPEALCNQMLETLTVATTDRKQYRKNQKVLVEALKKASRELGLVKCVGKSREKVLIEQLTAELDPSRSYTAYDITDMLISMPERLVGLDDAMLKSLRKAVGSVPYIKYAKPAEANVVLTA